MRVSVGVAALLLCQVAPSASDWFMGNFFGDYDVTEPTKMGDDVTGPVSRRDDVTEPVSRRDDVTGPVTRGEGQS